MHGPLNVKIDDVVSMFRIFGGLISKGSNLCGLTDYAFKLPITEIGSIPAT